MSTQTWRAGNVVFIFATSLYAGGWRTSKSLLSDQILVLLVGIPLSRLTSWLALRRLGFNEKRRVIFWVVTSLVIMLSTISPWQRGTFASFHYLGQARWTGVWKSPNIYGLLLAVGITVAFGLLLQEYFTLMQTVLNSTPERSHEAFIIKSTMESNTPVWCFIAFFACCIGSMAIGLVHSYSRGSWLGALCGVALLVLRVVRSQERVRNRRLRRNLIFLYIILCSVCTLSLWQFTEMEWRPVRRALSAINSADFSWRNRVAAWQGAMQMSSEHPIFGIGWGLAERMYSRYYRSVKVNEGAAIAANDFLVLGATLGIPALAGLALYIWHRLRGKCGFAESLTDGKRSRLRVVHAHLLPTTCRAGILVFLVGFWFDGGLFDLATAAPFWILLECGQMSDLPLHVSYGNDFLFPALDIPIDSRR